MLRSLQTQIFGAGYIIPYVDIIASAYPTEVIQAEPMIGLKIGLIDNSNINPKERLFALEQVLPVILGGTRCMLRETPLNAPFGYYLLTLPVPRDQLRGIVDDVMRVLTILENQFGITVTKEYEINVSGQCNPMELEYKLARFEVPAQYSRLLIHQSGTPFTIGRVERINPMYITVRTKWKFGAESNVYTDFEHIKVLAHLIAGIY